MVRFHAADLPVDAAAVRRAVLDVVRAHVGWPDLRISMDETVEVRAAAPLGDGWRVDFIYMLDRDFASQYDKTETTAGFVFLDAHGAPVGGELG